MSLINQMLKDLEKRRSRDLETSESLSNNITWETQPEINRFNYQALIVVIVLIALITIIAFLFWERNTFQEQLANVPDEMEIPVKVKPLKQSLNKTPAPVKKLFVKKPVVEQEKETDITNQAYAETIEAENIVDTETIDNERPRSLQKKHRPLTKKQLAELEYKKGYQSLQQGSMQRGKEHLREALLLDETHLKAREMLSAIYIKSGHYVEAASLLSKGVSVVPDYSLFAKLYARVLLEQNNPQRAIEILERGAGASDVASDYQALLAATYQRVKNHEKAIEIYLKLVKLNPTVSIWWLGLAISLEKSGKNKAALDSYQRAQETGNLNAGLAKFTNNRVTALKEIGFPEKY